MKKLIKTKWWERFLLLFCRKRYSIDSDGIFRTVHIHKRLFGKVYILGTCQLPPQHFNCRCVVINV